RELHHRHRLRLHRSADADWDAGWCVMAVSKPGAGVVTTAGAPAPAEATAPISPQGAPVAARRSEFLYFAFRNWKFVAGLVVVLFFLVLAIFGPMLTPHEPLEFGGPTDQAPSSDYWVGTTSLGQA